MSKSTKSRRAALRRNASINAARPAPSPAPVLPTKWSVQVYFGAALTPEVCESFASCREAIEFAGRYSGLHFERAIVLDPEGRSLGDRAERWTLFEGRSVHVGCLKSYNSIMQCGTTGRGFCSDPACALHV